MARRSFASARLVRFFTVPRGAEIAAAISDCERPHGELEAVRRGQHPRAEHSLAPAGGARPEGGEGRGRGGAGGSAAAGGAGVGRGATGPPGALMVRTVDTPTHAASVNTPGIG